jgi:hypothetical protein
MERAALLEEFVSVGSDDGRVDALRKTAYDALALPSS